MEGRILGGTYRILTQLDEGGMGVVFEAEHLRLPRRVAVKVLSSRHAANPDMLARFQQEAEIVSRLEHPHVVAALDFDVTEAHEAYLVMELLHGETLEARLRKEAPLSLEEAVQIVLQLASALAAAHRAGIVHRDLKPSNVFLTHAPDEPTFVKLLDFGVSSDARSKRSLTHPGVLIGTPEYMAPEQAYGKNDLVRERSDQFSLAVVAYEMLTAVQPFLHEDITEVVKRVTRLDVPAASTVAPWIPPEVDAVLERALAKDPENRFEDIQTFARTLARAARVSTATPTAPSEPAPRHATNDDGPPKTMEPGRPPSLGKERKAATTRVGTEPLESDIRELPPGAASSRDAAHRVSEALASARGALEAGAVVEATAYAEAALRHGDDSEDEGVQKLLGLSESLLARIFMCRLGSPSRRLTVARGGTSSDLLLSPRAAFLLSRIELGLTVEDALDVAALPRFEALRCIVQLVSCGAVRLG